jgi:carboxyl-terminal processing protease
MNRLVIRRMLTAGLIATLPCTVMADDPKPAATLTTLPTPERETDSEKASNIESFEVVWKTIRDKHFDPKIGGLNWQAVHDELRPKVEKSANRAEARAVMSDCLSRLKLTHFGIIPGDVVRQIEDGKSVSFGHGHSGIRVRVVDGKAIVAQVEPGSPAEIVGVKTGWTLESVRGKTTAELLKALSKAYGDSSMLAARQALTIESRMSAHPGEKIDLEFLDGSDKPVKLTVELTKPKGTPARFGNLPTYYVRCETKRVDNSIGYVSLNAFFDPVNVIRTFAGAINDAKNAEGLIIDLRGNPGGIGAMSMGMGGWLVSDSNLKLGTMTTRDGSINFVLNPRPSPFTGPVAVLVDELSMSTSEILAGGLQDLKRARVFGTKTPGAALPSRIDILPNGDRFQYAFADYIAVGGKRLEGIGVTPDEPTPLTRSALLKGEDPAVAAAVRWIREQAKKTKS